VLLESSALAWLREGEELGEEKDKRWMSFLSVFVHRSRPCPTEELGTFNAVHQI